MELCGGEYLVRREHLHILLGEHGGHRIRGGAQVQKSALFSCFLYPRVVIAVTVEDNLLVILYRLLYHLVQGYLEVVGVFEAVGIYLQRLRDCGV